MSPERIAEIEALYNSTWKSPEYDRHQDAIGELLEEVERLQAALEAELQPHRQAAAIGRFVRAADAHGAALTGLADDFAALFEQSEKGEGIGEKSIRLYEEQARGAARCPDCGNTLDDLDYSRFRDEWSAFCTECWEERTGAGCTPCPAEGSP